MIPPSEYLREAVKRVLEKHRGTIAVVKARDIERELLKMGVKVKIPPIERMTLWSFILMVAGSVDTSNGKWILLGMHHNDRFHIGAVYRRVV